MKILHPTDFSEYAVEAEHQRSGSSSS